MKSAFLFCFLNYRFCTRFDLLSRTRPISVFAKFDLKNKNLTNTKAWRLVTPPSTHCFCAPFGINFLIELLGLLQSKGKKKERTTEASWHRQLRGERKFRLWRYHQTKEDLPKGRQCGTLLQCDNDLDQLSWVASNKPWIVTCPQCRWLLSGNSRATIIRFGTHEWRAVIVTWLHRYLLFFWPPQENNSWGFIYQRCYTFQIKRYCRDSILHVEMFYKQLKGRKDYTKKEDREKTKTTHNFWVPE